MSYDKAKELYLKNKHRISPIVALAKACVRDAASMRRMPNVMDYINVGFSWKEHYDEIMGPKSPSAYFNNDDWQPFFNHSFHEFIIELINHNYPKNVRMVRVVGNDEAYVAEIENFRFGWASSATKVEYFCIEKNGQERAFKTIEKIFWQQFASGKVIINVEKDALSIKEDLSHNDFIPFKKCNELADYVKEFFNQEVSRSILFYGPPGSGKSNLIKGITYCLDAKTIRFTDLSSITNSFVAELLRAINPDAVVLEDIDHMDIDEIDDLLDKLEDFGNQKKLTFATANKVSKLDDALLRPGRFDEVLEINHLDEEVLMKLVENDQELFDITKKFPVAFTVELLKRVKVLGKEKALLNMKDISDRVANLDNNNYELRDAFDDDAPFLRKFKKKLGLKRPADDSNEAVEEAFLSDDEPFPEPEEDIF